MADYNSGGRNSERNRTAADKIAEQRRRKTALEDMNGPRLNNKGSKDAPRLSSRRDSYEANKRQRNKNNTPKKNGSKNKIELFPGTGGSYSKQKTSVKSLFGKRNMGFGLNTGKIIAAVVVVFFVFLAFHMLTNKNAVEVFVDGESVGVVIDKTYTQDYVTDTCQAKLVSELGTNVQITSEITTQKVHAGSKDENVSTGDYLLKTVKDKVTYNVEATVIVVNNTEMAVVSNSDDAQTAIDRILSEHSLSYIEDTSSIVEGPEIVGLEFTTKFVEGTEIVSVDKAYELLNGTKQQQLTYTVESGDSFAKIAAIYGLEVTDLKAANPDITNITNISVGDEIKINATVPVLDIKVVTQTVDRTTGTAVIVKTTYINGVATDTANIEGGSSADTADTADTTETSDTSADAAEETEE